MLDSTEARLNLLVPDSLAFVGSAVSLATAMLKKPVQQSVCYVVPVAERALPTARQSGRALQLVDVAIGIVIGIQTLNDQRGDRGRESLEAVREAIRDQLFGWQPENSLVPYQLGNGDLLKMDHGQLWWLDYYHTQVQRRQKC